MQRVILPIERPATGVAAEQYGAVRAAIAPMLAEPHVSAGQVSQQLAGHRVAILEEQQDWVLARGADDYLGWMHAGYLRRPMLPDEGKGDGGERRVSLGCVTRSPGGARRALPLRAYVDDDLAIESGEVIGEGEIAARFPRTAAAITATALERFVGASYQWGGVTPWGADCSGLVQSTFALHGVRLPRDAWQQARAGRDAGRDPLVHDAGDLLFFSDRPDAHVTHVAISLGERRIVHLALGRGGWAVERLDDEGDLYVGTLRERFLFARRVL